MKLSEKIQEALREQQEINLSDPAVQKRLAAQWGYVPAGAQPAPEPCPCCGEAMMIYSRCRNASCEAVTVTPEQAKHNKVRAFMKTCATRLDEPTAPSVPDGWKLVPIEPTQEMRDAWTSHMYSSFRVTYQAMLAAAPEAKP